MAGLVLDCSAAMSWLVPDEVSPATAGLLDRVVSEGAIAPALWPTELANGLLTAQRRRRITRAQRMAALESIADLPIMIDLSTALAFWQAASALAEFHDLTVYDATYLELAHRERLPLATLDGPLRRAAERVGVPLFPR